MHTIAAMGAPCYLRRGRACHSSATIGSQHTAAGTQHSIAPCLHPCQPSPQLSTKKSAGTFVMPRGQRFVDNDVREAAQKVGVLPGLSI